MLLNLALEKGAYACEAARSGHRDIVFDMIRGRTDSDMNKATDWEMIADAAANGNLRDVVYTMISLGASNWDSIAFGAAKNHDLELLDFMYARCIKGRNTNTLIAQGAAMGGHLDLVKRFTEDGDYYGEEVMSTVDDYPEIINYLIEKQPSLLKQAVSEAAGNGKLDLVEDFLNRGTNNFNEIALIAAVCGHIAIIDLVRDKVTNWDKVEEIAKKNGYAYIHE